MSHIPGKTCTDKYLPPPSPRHTARWLTQLTQPTGSHSPGSHLTGSHSSPAYASSHSPPAHTAHRLTQPTSLHSSPSPLAHTAHWLMPAHTAHWLMPAHTAHWLMPAHTAHRFMPAHQPTGSHSPPAHIAHWLTQPPAPPCPAHLPQRALWWQLSCKTTTTSLTWASCLTSLTSLPSSVMSLSRWEQNLSMLLSRSASALSMAFLTLVIEGLSVCRQSGAQPSTAE